MEFRYLTHVRGSKVREIVAWIMANIDDFQIDDFHGHAGIDSLQQADVTFYRQKDAALFKTFCAHLNDNDD